MIRTPRQSITKRCYQVLKFITSYIAVHDEAPTLAEIRKYLGFNSQASVHAILIAMEHKGMITRTRKMRGIKVIQTNVV